MAGLALPIGLILAQQGIGALSRIIGQKPDSEGAQLPNLSTLMQTITSQGATQAATNQASIRGFGASRRLSAGATQSALAGASIEANRSTTQNLARVEPLKLGIARFKESRFQANRARSDERSDNLSNFFGAGLGGGGFLAVFALDDVDAHFRKHGHGVFDLLGRDLIGRQRGIEVVIGDVTALLAFGDHLLDRRIEGVEQGAVAAFGPGLRCFRFLCCCFGQCNTLYPGGASVARESRTFGRNTGQGRFSRWFSAP